MEKCTCRECMYTGPEQPVCDWCGYGIEGDICIECTYYLAVEQAAINTILDREQL